MGQDNLHSCHLEALCPVGISGRGRREQGRDRETPNPPEQVPAPGQAASVILLVPVAGIALFVISRREHVGLIPNARIRPEATKGGAPGPRLLQSLDSLFSYDKPSLLERKRPHADGG